MAERITVEQAQEAITAATCGCGLTDCAMHTESIRRVRRAFLTQTEADLARLTAAEKVIAACAGMGCIDSDGFAGEIKCGTCPPCLASLFVARGREVG